ncbi:response regulator transcription factor [Pandoraea apista]|uniref:Response regulator transcription factor n=1 Tax=Pandoraea apista TaxID=93218 RepID=A0A0B5F6M7_9BURK|nr:MULTISPECIES: response regulator transcription factor [Pandoraea]AJE99874.1 XRE family transcriptional regulator [Pandoraea apista]AKH74011.1 XRE family transcriptional regulator [Pandoraea apista]AKI62558.1 XRE family transcriptional regulator [Pandoraea apista]ALS64253.1 DNA-binding response regulator [Pandoraea apista]AVF40828.1 DNA-binding response regulator [Pandoraea apista]
MRILLVEDDTMIGEAMMQALKDASYAADWCRDGDAALAALAAHAYDLMLLDLGLPGRDGWEVLRAHRGAGGRTPIIVVTARDGAEDIIQGLDLGADDFVVKPFEVGELLARMRAVIRRQAGVAVPVLTNGALALDPATHQASYGENSCVLSAREYALLHALMLRPGTILSRDALEHRLYGWGEEIESNMIDFLIHSIRKKLGADVIRNIRGAGWLVPKA